MKSASIAPVKHDRELGEAGDLVEQAGIGLDRDPQLRRPAVEVGPDHVLATLLVDDHACAASSFSG